MTDLDTLVGLLRDKGAARYGDRVNQLQHALQCARLAERSGASDALVVAALFHDIGHLSTDDEGLAARGEDGRHEIAGAALLSRLFGPDVTEPVRLHVQAKRYLCTTNARYRARLSAASVTSLQVQGETLTADETAEFERSLYRDAAIALRSWDDNAKDPAATPPDLEHYRGFAERLLRDRR